MTVEYGVLGLVLLAASLTDIWYREVPDWISYSLIAFGALARVLRALAVSSFSPFLEGLAGFAVAFTLGCTLYYLGQWGGGDAKLIMGVGWILGFTGTVEPFFMFLVYTLLASCFYGLFWFFWLAATHQKRFMRFFKQSVQTRSFQRGRLLLWIVTLAVLIIVWTSRLETQLKLILMLLTLMFIVIFYLGYFAKAVERAALFKKVRPKNLVEGDWIATAVTVDDKVVLQKQKLGATKKSIALLKRFEQQKKLDFVIVKEGLPFVPAFLFGFILLLVL